MKTKQTILKSVRVMTLLVFLSATSWIGANAQSCNASFSYKNYKGVVDFANFSTGSTGSNGLFYIWDFGDGGTDNAKNPVHHFKYNGTYSVCLYIRDSSSTCNDSACQSIMITDACNPIAVTCTGKNPTSPSACDGTIYISSITGGVAPYTYTWSPNVSNSSSASNLCGRSYFITVTDANGCTGSVGYALDSSGTGGCSANVILFQDSTNSNPLEWYAYSNVTGVAPFNYLWDFGDGSTSTQQYPSHTYAVAGHYRICLAITDATGCTSYSCDTTYKRTQGGVIKNLIVVAQTTGIKENLFSVSSIFPNPVKDMLEISLSQFTQGELVITDISGREIYWEKISANNVKVNVSNFIAGYYTLSIVSGDKVSHNKVMIAR